VGVGVDFARAYAFKTQLKTVTDAAALAGVVEMVDGNTANEAPQVAALAYVPLNTIEGVETAYSADSNVDAVAWDFAYRRIDVSKGVNGSLDDEYTHESANALRVVARYTLNTTFGRVFGVNQWTIVDTTIAALGAITSSGCLKPWAIPYENILWTLGRPDPTDTSYVLQPEDVAYLRDNQKKIAFKVTSKTGNPNDTTTDPLVHDEFGNQIPGNYFPVRYGPVRDPDGVEYPTKPDAGGAEYREKIGEDCAAGAVQVGDYLEVEQGVAKGPTKQGVEDLCDLARGQGKTFNCDKDILLPIWAGTYKLGGPKNVRVKYIGAFHLTNYDDGLVTGYLTGMGDPSGGFGGGVGPVQKGAIVY
jgi:hypothetical protein